MRRLAIALVAVVALVAGGLAVTGSGPFAAGVSAPSPTAGIGPVPESDSVAADGAVVPVRAVGLAPSVGGRVTFAAAEGTAVTAGTVVLRLDTAQADAAVAVAEAAIPVAEAHAAQATAGATQAKRAATAAKYARDQAKAILDGAKAQRDQLPSGASRATKRAADANIRSAQAAYRVAGAQLDGARAAATAATASATAAAAEVTRARTALEQAQVARAQLEVTAPFAGTVAFAAVEAGEMAGSGVVAIRIADVSGWRIETTDLDETAVSRIRIGSQAEVRLDAFGDALVRGTVREIAAYGEARQGDIVYRVLVEPDEPLPAGVRWNMTASVTISTR